MPLDLANAVITLDDPWPAIVIPAADFAALLDAKLDRLLAQLQPTAA